MSIHSTSVAAPKERHKGWHGDSEGSANHAFHLRVPNNKGLFLVGRMPARSGMRARNEGKRFARLSGSYVIRY